MQPAVSSVNISKVTSENVHEVSDLVAVEIPLEIRIIYGKGSDRQKKSISVIMRTPGNDFELAAGFLITEGIVKGFSDILFIRYCEDAENVVNVDIKEDVIIELKTAERNFYTSSGCGICGKTSIDAVKYYANGRIESDVFFSRDLISSLPKIIYTEQNVFKYTGGLHAAALFNSDGELMLIREDVGRHNATDKLIGAAAALNLLPLNNYLLLLSGRAGFELLQKAAMAGVGVVASVGAPSSLAIELASECNITLIGFLRDNRFNIYTVPSKIKI
mgnify:FL=1